ncbi:endolytic transglycosylase MltG [Alteromonas aestuariivivens]|uniref:Endolytic murein transglycosylase n=1 Tax=Alteromonas aestuariivivens TaxID=1938339 RepID=A0A3D8MAW0_9ALTE|nr:endolytic transglycosylase MltG [Alteromonas aestuariivivens]RDV27420.1 endolytic transglycosylase MltG [Alteromonas aestuariivivens]
MTSWIRALLGTAVLAVVVLVVAYTMWQEQLNTPLALSRAQLVTIEAGTTGHQAAKLLRQKGWLKTHPLAVRVWLKLDKSAGAVKAGTYQVQPGMNVEDAFEVLSSGEEFQFSVGLIEGQSYSQWLGTLKAQEHLDFDMTDEQAEHLLRSWPWPMKTPLSGLEGLLLADTYYFTSGTPVSAILTRAMAAMIEFMSVQWPQRSEDLPLGSPYEALILASIVEKETAVPEERARIAGVFVNRLNRNMRLQTDPTVIYGLGSEFDGNITRAHLKQKTAYNTYVIKGLPPTPIAMAGRAAIQAALKPMVTDELYFVARGDGTHQFSETLEAHNRAVYQYQINKEK